MASIPCKIYALEAALLGTFMLSACTFGILLEHPGSPLRDALPSPFIRRALMGLAMGATAIALIYSRPGRRTGAHMNPAVTLSFLRLGRISPPDALGYIVAHFIGATLGVGAALFLAGMHVAHPSVNFVATLPGGNSAVAWLAEAAIAFLMMTTVLTVNRYPRLAPRTGLFAGTLVAVYITFEAPLSGMSLNPARSFGSAFFAHAWESLWIYFTAPVIGMLAAVELSCRLTPNRASLCCKAIHCPRIRCHCPCTCMTPVTGDFAQTRTLHAASPI